MRKFLTVIVSIIVCSMVFKAEAQKQVWTVNFPGYTSNLTHATLAGDNSINLVMMGGNGMSSKYATINSKGQLTYQEPVGINALAFIEDSSGNQYKITRNSNFLFVKKSDPQGVVVWNQSYPVASTMPFDLAMQFSSSSAMFHSNGNLIFTSWLNWANDFDMYSINPVNGALDFHYEAVNFSIMGVNNTVLQEDSLGNINCLYSDYLWPNSSSVRFAKITTAGALLQSVSYVGSPITDFRADKKSIYLGMGDINSSFVKININTFDTIFEINTQMDIVAPENSFVTNDSAIYLLYKDFGSPAIFERYDTNGNLECRDSSLAIIPGTLVPLNNTVVNVIDYVYQLDSNCSFDTISEKLNSNLIAGLTSTYFGYDPLYYLTSNEVLFIKSGYSDLNILGIIEEETRNITGKQYVDLNNNCSYDSIEPPVPNQLINIQPGNLSVFTDQNGEYKTILDTGVYQLNSMSAFPGTSVCPATIPVNVTNSNQILSNNDFGLQSSGNMQDLEITLNQSNVVPGFSSTIRINVTNKMPVPASGIVKLNLNPAAHLTYLGYQVPDSISGNNYYWHIDTLGYLETYAINVVFRVDSLAVLGSQFTNTAEVTNINGEINLSNNVDVYQGMIVGSFDPNNKSVYPAGAGVQGTISPLDTVLNYKINFQNTGNHPAYTVIVRDTIDADLNLTSFQLKTASHPCIISVENSNVLVFTFNDILLPDSNSNEEQSHGFINYSIHLKPNLPLLTEIRNSAAIYFDFNVPVITNQTINTINVVGIQEQEATAVVQLYPNPATDKLKINLAELKAAPLIVDIYDIVGQHIQTVYNGSAKGTSMQLEADLSGMTPGIYLIRILQEGVIAKRFVKL